MTLWALASVLQFGQPRDLDGVFEVHGAAVIGISPVFPDNSFRILACKSCNGYVADRSAGCLACTDSEDYEYRWVFSLSLADQTASCDATVYHDAAEFLSFLTNPITNVKLAQGFRSTAWSLRLVYKRNPRTPINYLEIKQLESTIT